MKLFRLVFIILSLGLLTACEEQLSERDVKMQQQLNQNEVKRKELLQVSGKYMGLFNEGSRGEQNIKLEMEVKDLPAAGDTSVDPILYPTLVGHLRMILGDEELGEYIDCPIQKSEYVASNKRLHLIVSNEQFKEMDLMLSQVQGSLLQGTWTAPAVGQSGKASLVRE